MPNVPVLLFALAGGPQPSPVSHLQDGGGSFNLSSREEFVLLSRISFEVRSNAPCEAGHWWRPGAWCVGLSVAEVGGPSAFRKGERKCLREAGGELSLTVGSGSAAPAFLGLIYQGRVSVENCTGSAGLEEGRVKLRSLGYGADFLERAATDDL